MPKVTVQDWDATPANNTDINGINIQGSAAVSNFDDALRTLMSQIKTGVDYKQVFATKTGSYTAVLLDNNAFHNFTGATPTLTLTAAATLGANWHYLGYASGGPVIIDPNAAELINGSATITVPQYCNFAIICDGSAFFCLVDAAQAYVDAKPNQNVILNPDFRVSQRGTTFSTPASGSYTADMWFTTWTGAAPASVAQVAGPSGYPNALRITGAASNTSVAYNQRYPSKNVAHLVGKQATLQMAALASVSQTVKWELYHATAVDNFTSLTLHASGTWASINTGVQTFSAVISALPAGAANGLQLVIYPNNQGAFTSGTFDLTYVKLEQGAIPTAFQFIEYGDSLRECQQFCWQDTVAGSGYVLSGAVSANIVVNFPTRMYKVPTLTNVTNGAVDSTSSVATTGASLDLAYQTSARVIVTTGAAIGTFGFAANLRGQVLRFEANL